MAINPSPVNMYAFNVKRLSLMMKAGANTSATADAGTPAASAGFSAYEGDQVYVVATSLANAIATLGVQYGSDLGPISGGAMKTPGAITQLA
jgi:hypothetical protein